MRNKQKGLSLEFMPINEIETAYADKDIVMIEDIQKIPKELLTGGPLNPNFYILVVCLEGKMQVEINGKTFVLGAYDILFNNSNSILNSCMISPNCKANMLCLSPQIVSQLLHTGKSIWTNNFYTYYNPVVNVGEEGRKLYMAYFKLIELKLKQQHPYYKESLSGMISAVLYDIHAYFAKQHSSLDNDRSTLTQGNLLFNRFIELLSKEEVKKRQVQYYADNLCIGAKYLSTTVREISGKTAFEWINEYVVVDIQYYLKHSDKSIKEVADMLGFDNLSFFGKYVKKYLGMSPTDYRKEFNERAK